MRSPRVPCFRAPPPPFAPQPPTAGPSHVVRAGEALLDDPRGLRDVEPAASPSIRLLARSSNGAPTINHPRHDHQTPKRNGACASRAHHQQSVQPGHSKLPSAARPCLCWPWLLPRVGLVLIPTTRCDGSPIAVLLTSWNHSGRGGTNIGQVGQIATGGHWDFSAIAPHDPWELIGQSLLRLGPNTPHYLPLASHCAATCSNNNMQETLRLPCRGRLRTLHAFVEVQRARRQNGYNSNMVGFKGLGSSRSRSVRCRGQQQL